MQLTVLIRE